MPDTIEDLRPIRIEIEQAVVEEYDLTPYEGWLYVVIVSHASKAKKEAFPGLTRLAKLAKMSRNKVIACIEALEQKGLLNVIRTTVVAESGKKQNEVNHYQIPQATKAGSPNLIKVPLVHDMHYPSASDASPLVHEVHPIKIKEDKDKDPADKPAIPLEVVKSSKPKRERKPKPYDGVDPKEIDALIAAWVGQLQSAPISNPYQNTTNRTYCANFIRAGFGVDDVTRFMTEMYKQTFWRNKFMSFKYIDENLPTWVKANPVKTPGSPQNVSAFSNWRLAEMEKERMQNAG